MPMTPFIGVRISWLMLARKSDLSRDASVASSRASDMAASASASARDVGERPDPTCDPTVVVRDGLRGHEHDPRGLRRDPKLESLSELGLDRRRRQAARTAGPAGRSELDVVVPRLPGRSVGRDAVISAQRGFVYTYRFSASVWKMPMGAASVRSLS